VLGSYQLLQSFRKQHRKKIGMNQRTEPNKVENEAAIAQLKRETRGEHPMKYRDARAGATTKVRPMVNSHETWNEHGYTVRAFDDNGQSVEVAFFPLDDFDEGKRRETARMMAEELADTINNS
jgi:hypothetical protein